MLVSIGGGVAEVAIGTAKGLKSGEIQDALKRYIFNNIYMIGIWTN